MIHINIKRPFPDSVQPNLDMSVFVFVDDKQIRNSKDSECRSDNSFRKESQGMYFDVSIQQADKTYERYCKQPIL